MFDRRDTVGVASAVSFLESRQSSSLSVDPSPNEVYADKTILAVERVSELEVQLDKP